MQGSRAPEWGEERICFWAKVHILRNARTLAPEDDNLPLPEAFSSLSPAGLLPVHSHRERPGGWLPGV